MEAMGLNDPFWRDRRVLVTGATGLLGGWLVRRLLELGADVVCIVRDWVPESLLAGDGMHKVKVVRGDVRDSSLVERAIGEYEVATIFHLAAQTIVGIANRNPVATFETNIQGTWTVLEACRRVAPKAQLIVASSDKAYGSAAILPYTEDTPLVGQHPYDVSKSCADLLAQSYALTYGLPVTVTRCGNLYGGGDLNWNRVVPGTIRSALRGEAPVIRSDGRYVRDYFYVEDAAAAYTLLAENLASTPNLAGEAFNFSSGGPITVLDLVQRILRLVGSDLEPDVRNEAASEIREQSLSADKAERVLGWRAQFDLDSGLERTIRWYEAFLGGRSRATARA